MSKLLKRHWQSELAGSGVSRRDRRSCDYQAYVPDPLVGRRFVLEGDVAADVADAEAAITRLNAQATALVDTEALARILLRAESVAMQFPWRRSEVKNSAPNWHSRQSWCICPQEDRGGKRQAAGALLSWR
jgi:hypothetical protein